MDVTTVHLTSKVIQSYLSIHFVFILTWYDSHFLTGVKSFKTLVKVYFLIVIEDKKDHFLIVVATYHLCH